ncbi:hypothetical protein ACIBG4_26045 [Nonomuraea sp. NPDC050383]|uniref:hypothetical protein n=1 Tax=Nonomuraea sp. NPDC050383 TaxID=3364362 RepID=UPI00379DB38D
MLKRRVGILGAVGVLALSILSGSALADETPSPAPEGAIVCRTSDGETLSFAKGVKALKVVKLEDGKVVVAEGDPGEPAELARVKDFRLGRAVPAEKAEKAEKVAETLPEGAPELRIRKAEPGEEAKILRLKEGGLKEGELKEGKVKGGETEVGEAVPALPAEGPDGVPPKGVKDVKGVRFTVVCKAEKE